jgi:hypothetical protein
VIDDARPPVKGTDRNTEAFKRSRANLRAPWSKGVSGNPRGRPKTLSSAQDLARAATPDAIQALIETVRQRSSLSPRVNAAVALLDRAWGKPVQAVEHSGPEGERLFPAPADLDDAHLERMLQLARELRAAAHGNGAPAP